MTSPPADSPLTWSLVVPVKVLARAKSRLAAAAGPYRPALALAMAADTVAAALACPEVARVIAVTDDPQAAQVLAGLGAIVISDEPDQGLNPALRHGAATAAERWPGSGIAALAADLPALRPAELGLGLRAAARWEHAFVPDAAGSGTTLYAARPGAEFRPRFGTRSAGAPGRRRGRTQPARPGQPAPGRGRAQGPARGLRAWGRAAHRRGGGPAGLSARQAASTQTSPQGRSATRVMTSVARSEPESLSWRCSAATSPASPRRRISTEPTPSARSLAGSLR